MRFAKVESKYYCGIDLHSRSMYISVMDKEGEILFHRNMPNDFDIFKNYVERFRPEMAAIITIDEERRIVCCLCC